MFALALINISSVIQFRKKGITLNAYDSMLPYYVIDTMKVFNVQKNHNTILTFKDIKINSNINDDIFQEKNLKRIIY